MTAGWLQRSIAQAQNAWLESTHVKFHGQYFQKSKIRKRSFLPWSLELFTWSPEILVCRKGRGVSGLWTEREGRSQLRASVTPHIITAHQPPLSVTYSCQCSCAGQAVSMIQHESTTPLLFSEHRSFGNHYSVPRAPKVHSVLAT